MDSRYEEQFRNFLIGRLEDMQANPYLPWAKATDTPILSGYAKNYKGIDLLMITNHCRINNIPQRIFCTYQQRILLGKPVRKSESGMLVKGLNNKVYPVFPVSVNNKKYQEAFIHAEQKQKELQVKLRAWADAQKKHPFNDKGVCSAIYNYVLNKMPVKNNLDRLFAEIASASIVLQAGISKTIEIQNIHRITELTAILKNKRSNLGGIIKILNNEVKLSLEYFDNQKIDTEKHKANIATSLKELEVKEPVSKKIRLEDILTPKIRR